MSGNTYLNTYLKRYVRQKTGRKKYQKNHPSRKNQPRGDSARRNGAGIGLEGKAESESFEGAGRNADKGLEKVIEKNMKYDYWVEVKSLIPPLGNKKFFAVAKIHEIDKGEIDHDLGEVWGETRNEADEKMRKKIKEWLKDK